MKILREIMKWIASTSANYWPPVIALLAFLIGWQVFVEIRNIAPLVLPAPSGIATNIGQHFGAYVSDARVTLYEAMLGLGVAFIFSMSLAALMVHIPVLNRALEPLQTILRCTPILALAPALTLWLGFATTPKVVMSAIIVFSPFLLNALTGLRAINEETYEVFRSVNASNWEIFFKLRVPHALPYLFSAAKLCVTLSLVGAIVAEWAGSSEGLGYTILAAQKDLETTTIWGCIVFLAAIGLLLTGVVSLLEKRCLRWMFVTK